MDRRLQPVHTTELYLKTYSHVPQCTLIRHNSSNKIKITDNKKISNGNGHCNECNNCYEAPEINNLPLTQQNNVIPRQPTCINNIHLTAAAFLQTQLGKTSSA